MKRVLLRSVFAIGVCFTGILVAQSIFMPKRVLLPSQSLKLAPTQETATMAKSPNSRWTMFEDRLEADAVFKMMVP